MIPWFVRPAVLAVTLEHRSPHDLTWSLDNLDSWMLAEERVADLARDLSQRRCYLLDFLAALFQQRYVLPDRVAQGNPDWVAWNGQARERARDAVNCVLADWGLAIGQSGTVVDLAELHAEPAHGRRTEVAGSHWEDALVLAWAELRDGAPADALTDIGRALQVALSSAGAGGQTIGQQMRSLRQGPYFTGLDAKIGDAVRALGEWVAGARNTRSDAHPGEGASAAQARFALRLVAALGELLEAQVHTEDSPI